MTYLRTYAEPAMSDLYYLHEMVHAVLLYEAPRVPQPPLFTAWYRKMNGIELSASLETECYVYLTYRARATCPSRTRSGPTATSAARRASATACAT